MDTALQILQMLQSLGVSVSVLEGDRLRFKPAERIPADLIPTLREAKRAILEILHGRPATCSPSCYEVEPGRWIHRPWDGCSTRPSPMPSPTVAQAECKHCDGAGECSCPACTLRRSEEPVPCLMCQPQKRQIWLAVTRPAECKSARLPF